MEGFYKTYLDIVEMIDESVKQGRIVPALILLYASIDSFSSLTANTDKKGKSVFKNWVRQWMLKKYPLPCNENDIYAARCGLLHQQVSKSDLSDKREAKEIYYAWGNKSVTELQKKVNKTNKKDGVIAIKVEDLFSSFKKGMIDCLDAIDKDENWREVFEEKVRKFFVNIER